MAYFSLIVLNWCHRGYMQLVSGQN